MSATVSIIVPCYNAERTLAATLDSALAQDGVPIEIVVIDDGSKDGSLAVARRFEPRVRVIAGLNHGASAARNAGIAATSAPWIVFLDADDWLEPGTLARRLAVAKETQADVVITDWLDVIDNGSDKLRDGSHRVIDWAALEADAELAIATHAWATTAAILYRRRIVERIDGFRADLPVIQDARFLFDAARQGARFAHGEHIGARYRIVEGSLSRRDPGRFWRDVLLNGEQIDALWRARGALSASQARALAYVYDNAVRGLFAAGHADYFRAAGRQRTLGLPLSLHGTVSGPLAGAFGLRAARAIMTFGQAVATPLRRAATARR